MKIIQNAEFMLGATTPASFPKHQFPEIAFAGRSNVGKSSLLNTIVHRKNLAKISSTPGKTQQINFYLVENKWCFADLPGFGYAVTSKSNRGEWLKLNLNYLQHRENLKLVCMLVDSRHDPMDTDLGMIEWLENNQKPYLIVLTKCDKINKTQVLERKQQFEELLQNCQFNVEVLPTSAEKNEGRDHLLAIINKAMKDTFKAE